MTSAPTTPDATPGDPVSATPEPDRSQPAPVSQYIVTGAFVGVNGVGDRRSAFLYRGSRVPAWATPAQIEHLLEEKLIEPVDESTYAGAPIEVGAIIPIHGDRIPRLIVNED